MIERSLVLMKPDAVQRGITGEIIMRLERMGLKIIGMKMLHPDPKFVEKHYLTTDKELTIIGERTLQDCEENDIDVVENVGTTDPVEIGRQVWNWNVGFLSSGPVAALVFEGPSAISNIRMQVGHALPGKSAPGTIRGDFGLDSSIGANSRKRTIYNLVHASGNKSDAEREIKLWFKEEELLDYRRVHEDLYSY